MALNGKARGLIAERRRCTLTSRCSSPLLNMLLPKRVCGKLIPLSRCPSKQQRAPLSATALHSLSLPALECL